MSDVKVERPRSGDRYTLPYQELSDEIKSLTTAAEEFTIRLHALEVQPNSFTPEVQRDIQNVKKKSESLASQLSSLSDKVEKQREGIESLKQQIEKLRQENKKLKSQLECVESVIETLELGQMMAVIERNLSKFILLPEKRVGDGGGLTYMIGYYKGKQINEKQLDRWVTLQRTSNMTWTKQHLDAFREIKTNRNATAHSSKIDYIRVKQQIDQWYNHWGNEFSHFVTMHKKLNCILVLGHIACEFQDHIVSFILQGKRKMSVAEMIKWLKDNKASEEGKAANTRWSNLVLGKKWTSKHEEALSELMGLKRKGTILHLDIDFEEAKTHVADYMPQEYKQQSSDIIDMMKTFPKQSGLPWKLPK